MAPGWWTKLKGRLGRQSPESMTEIVPPATHAAVPTEPTSQMPPSSAPGSRWDFLLTPLPLAMFIVGGLLTACSELLAAGGWYLLGYLLLVASPIVYWLQRIERRLTEQLSRTRDR